MGAGGHRGGGRGVVLLHMRAIRGTGLVNLPSVVLGRKESRANKVSRQFGAGGGGDIR